MIRILIVLPIFWDAGLTWSAKDVFETSSEMCNEGEVITNHCLECLCSENSVYNCTSTGVPCPEGIGKKHSKKTECEPQLVYVYKETTCMCRKNGRWPHKQCRDVFNALPSKQICTPNSYVMKDCNVCRCGPTGKIDRKHCTQNDCSDVVRRRSSKLDKVQGSCEPKNWYSLAPCQFCYCVNENKLVCSTGNNKLSTVLELGAYNLTVCGKQMIKEVIELVPEVQRSLRGVNTPPHEEVAAEMTAKERVDKNNKIYEQVTSESVLPKPTRVRSPHKKSQVIEPDESEPVNREEKENVNENDNKATDSYSSDEDEIPIIRTTKLTRKPYKRQQTVTTTVLYPEGDTSEETVISERSKVAEEIPTGSVQHGALVNKKTHLKIPLSAKVTFENVVDTQQAKPITMNTGSSNDDVYNINFPSVLDKILSMTLKRRSMVKLNAQSNCVPGQTTKEGCNNCFCLANGKLLCTHKPCNGTSSEPQ